MHSNRLSLNLSLNLSLSQMMPLRSDEGHPAEGPLIAGALLRVGRPVAVDPQQRNLWTPNEARSRHLMLHLLE